MVNVGKYTIYMDGMGIGWFTSFTISYSVRVCHHPKGNPPFLKMVVDDFEGLRNLSQTVLLLCQGFPPDFSLTLRILTPPMETPDLASDTKKAVFDTP